MNPDDLDYHLISEEPVPLFMGELPRRYEEVPARVIVNLCGVYPMGEPFGRVLHALPMLDVLDEDLLVGRAQLERFLSAVHHQVEAEPSYWHCHAGLNRSGLAIAAYLHLYRGHRISEAIGQMRQQRTPMVLCNELFERTLRRWYGAPDEQEFAGFSLDDYLRERGGRSER